MFYIICSFHRKAERIVDLQQQQWNYLTKRHESGTMILQEIIAPFETNPNVKIELQLETCSINICGVPDAVISAYDHINNQLNKDLHVQDRYVNYYSITFMVYLYTIASNFTLVSETFAGLRWQL